jgi:alcohol dehydrogenase YqhD (iron-dependent ADH family)
MNNFEFKNPTKIVFGKDQIQNVGKEIPQDAKVLMLYGGGSIKKKLLWATEKYWSLEVFLLIRNMLY